MKRLLSYTALHQENRRFAGSGGVSRENRAQGFVPAFYDTRSHRTVISRFANGDTAPIHLLEGLPEEWVVARDASGRVTAVKDSVIAGFLRQGRFYTREQAAQAGQALNPCRSYSFTPISPTRSVQEPVKKDDEDQRSGVKDAGGMTWWLPTRVE